MTTWELLRGVPPEDVQRVLAIARRRTYRRGEVVFHEGDPADALHLIAKGRFAARVTTRTGESALLSVRGPGLWFGELALVGDGAEPRSATVASLDAGETHAVSRADFARLRREHASVSDVLAALLAAELRRTTGLLLDAYYAPAERRVLRRLAEQADGDGVVALTQEDVAELAGTSRATVNKVLREAERRGHVELRRARTVVLDADALRR